MQAGPRGGGDLPPGRRPRRRWPLAAGRGTVGDVPALSLRLVARRHVDLARVASAICRRGR
ncbi:putative leader peptide [Actinomycetospora rhizophila]|uniref:Leader peptide n=1 Tax=Actinomycetospora rhizophila TaxID=1416876 RepID=A0ABV9ZDK9_9PSEU